MFIIIIIIRCSLGSLPRPACAGPGGIMAPPRCRGPPRVCVYTCMINIYIYIYDIIYIYREREMYICMA